MNLKPRITAQFTNVPSAFRDFKNVEFTDGNVVVSTEGMTVGQEVKAFTAVHFNQDKMAYELVKADTPETMVGAVVTTEPFIVEEVGLSEMVPAVRKAALIPERCTGITDNFKKATIGRLTFDV